MAQLLLLNGPNLNLLGRREPHLYGADTLPDIERRVSAAATAAGHRLDCFQTNSEAELVDRIHEANGRVSFILINPGALTHTSYALRDAIAAVAVRAVEVHLSDIHAREPWRRESRVREVCARQISGKGVGSYLEALDWLADARTPSA